jgi:DNA-binding CsgD family transcriptional regulator
VSLRRGLRALRRRNARVMSDRAAKAGTFDSPGSGNRRRRSWRAVSSTGRTSRRTRSTPRSTTEGLTDAEVAERILVSIRTVHAHLLDLSHARRTDAKRRNALGRRARPRGLTIGQCFAGRISAPRARGRRGRPCGTNVNPSAFDRLSRSSSGPASSPGSVVVENAMCQTRQEFEMLLVSPGRLSSDCR